MTVRPTLPDVQPEGQPKKFEEWSEANGIEGSSAIPGFDHGASAQRIADAVLESNQTGQWGDVST